MLSGLQKFGITPDEGPLGENESDIGNYGPYTQSLRGAIYQTFAKKLNKNSPKFANNKPHLDNRLEYMEHSLHGELAILNPSKKRLPKGNLL